MGNNRARHGSAFSAREQHKRALLGNVCALAVALAISSSPALAKDKSSGRHKEAEHVSKDPFGNIPKGPLQIFISINQQELHLYSDGKHVEDAMVATGMPGHATPMGIFSIIDKDRYHHSNIYSGAPMPYMQRITWSGVALHEGVGLGHPASHGCIRMPHEFAARLWVLSKLGMRVVIARTELKPTDFADPHLFVHKELPAPAPAASIAVEPVKTAQTTDSSKTTDAIDAPMPGPTAEARQSNSPTGALLSKSVAVGLDLINDAKDVAIGIAAGLAADPTKAAAAASDAKDASAGRPAKSDPASSDAAKPAAPPQQAQTVEPGKAVVTETGTSAPAKAEADAVAPVTIDLEPVPIPLPKPEALVKAAAGKSAPIAIFVSRRNSKIYVRQNFAPLFSAPITIDHPEQPLGTHLFSALEYKDDNSTFRWNLVSLPAEQPKARHSDDDRKSEKSAKEKRKAEAEAPPPPPPTAAQSLARIEIPEDVIEQISELIVPGSSLIVSDQGLGEETGEYTEFIVVTR